MSDDTSRRDNLGCLILGLRATAVFFFIGAVVSLITGDILVMFQALVMTFLLLALTMLAGRAR